MTIEDHDGTMAVATRVTELLGGVVRSVARQPRWRPVWFVELEHDDGLLELCVRGDRTDTLLTFPLEHEMRFQRVAHEAGIRVPKVYGWIDEPAAYVMDMVPGRPDFAGVPEADRAVIVDEYVQELARLHQLPVEPFAEAAIARAAPGQDPAHLGLARFEDNYRAQKRRPDPFLEWALSWVHRHLPRGDGREAPIVWDSGQFLHHDGHFTTIMDVELAHLGDPMMDLAGWRMRDSVIPFGDFGEIYARYGELTGEPVDLEAIELHHIIFTLTNELSFSHTLRDPTPGSDFATNMQWCNETNLYATEAIADYMGLGLPTVPTPEPRRGSTSVASAHLAQSLRSLHVDDPVLRHQIRISFRVAQHLARADEIGAEILEADLDDLHQVLGCRPHDWTEAEEQLEQFVLADRETGRHDEVLLPLFHRRNLRAQLLNGPEGSAMARHNEIQRFPRRSARR